MIPAPSRRLLLAGAALSAAPAPGPGAAAQGASQALSRRVADANAGTVGVIAGGVDGTYIRIASDLSAVLDEGNQLRVLAMLGKGSLQNLQDIVLLRGVDIGIVQSDSLAAIRRQRLLGGAEGLIRYIAKLYDEEIHLLARPGIERLQDLAGQVVNVDVEGSGTAMTAGLVFDALGLTVRPAHERQEVAMTRLQRGEIAALMFIAGKPARLFSNVPAGTGLRFLPIAPTVALMETYLPGTLAAADYPTLVAGEEAVETIAVGAVMAAYAHAPGSDRYRKVARFVEALQARFGEFQQPPRHPKWREVNLAAQLPGWTRFDHTVRLPPGR